jgi:hypothetical protein
LFGVLHVCAGRRKYVISYNKISRLSLRPITPGLDHLRINKMIVIMDRLRMFLLISSCFFYFGVAVARSAEVVAASRRGDSVPWWLPSGGDDTIIHESDNRRIHNDEDTRLLAAQTEADETAERPRIVHAANKRLVRWLGHGEWLVGFEACSPCLLRPESGTLLCDKRGTR